MKAAAQGVAEKDLHAYLDGELSQQRVAKVEDYLDRERPAAERLVHYGVQGDLIRRLYGPLINRPMPPQLVNRLPLISEEHAHPLDEPKRDVRAEGRKARKTPGVLFLLLLIVAIGIGLWFFQPAMFGSMPAMIETLSWNQLRSLLSQS